MNLNSIEKLKNKQHPSHFLKNFKNCDFNNLDEESRFYLKSVGIYNFKMTPEVCMIRVRISAGHISIKQFEHISEISKRYNTKLILTARAQIEFHQILNKDIFDIYEEINLTQLGSYLTLGDNIRNITSDPLDGVGLSSKIEVFPIVKEIEDIFLKKDEFSSMLPRKFNIAISGNTSNITSFFSNDLYFAIAKKDEEYGFNIYLGGKNNKIAKCANIFVEKENVKNICEAILKAYNKYGLREKRNKTRLFSLIEKIGLLEFKKCILEFYTATLCEAGDTLITKEDYKDFIPIRNNKYCFRYQTNFGELESLELNTIIKFAKKENLQIKLGNDQNIYLIGLKNSNTPFENNQGSSNILACAGGKYCFFSIFDVKDKAYNLDIKKLEQHNINIGYSGCLKGCGRHQFCDIGLISIRTNAYGNKEQAVRFFLGAQYSTGKAAGRMIYWAVPLRELNNLIDIVIDEFINSDFNDFQDFSSNILNTYSENFLSFWFLCKIYTNKKIYLQPFPKNKIQNEENEKQYLKNIFRGNEINQFLSKNLTESIRILLLKVWIQ
ncbi:MAG: nitrite/sulfite reductase [Arcobacteraceae bacterium]|nr:nitrite/sulfite reductase [Arcobacteraceae bacterium]